MPTYQYYCRKCDRTFERVQSIRERDEAKKQPSCPECEGEEVEQELAPFFAKTSRKS